MSDATAAPAAIRQGLSEPSGSPDATYERRVAASSKRVWENVLDWEHLPSLHASSFVSIRCEGSGPWGWRAVVGIEGMEGPRDTSIELLVDRAKDHYVTRTLAGPGAGNEIWTRVQPDGTDATHVSVAFHLEGVPAESREYVGQAFVNLYTRLWDEDEGMMVERQRMLDAGRLKPAPPARAPHALGDAGELRARLPEVVEAHGRAYRIVEDEGELLAHPTVCPHWGGPLDEAPLESGAVACPWHGYRFDLRSGQERSGRRCRLGDLPRVEVDAGGHAQLVFPEHAP
ncbi:MAG: Rieske 2Fe-2S domain-containing protein [Myxococcota bacterium]|nr:Rieske 2Fe-2S domain-containing protein [Myxococcota bacterium]